MEVGRGDWRQVDVLSLLVQWAPSTMGKSEEGQRCSSLNKESRIGPCCCSSGLRSAVATVENLCKLFYIYDLQFPGLYKGS